jgi:hypothetical protein
MALQMYHCMIIITDGEIHDMQETIDVIVELSNYPVSIIIIGVGDDDFINMHRLDSDDSVLKSSKGQPAMRDIVQFVRFKDFVTSQGGENISGLAEDVLREMPDQIVNYMLSKNIKPLKLDWMDANHM